MPATAGGEAMANEEQVKRLLGGAPEWNEWRTANPRTRVNLSGADLSRAILDGTNLLGADLRGAELNDAKLNDANLTRARLGKTIFADVDLTSTTGLDQCDHHAPSFVDYFTLQKSGALPLAFLRGVGLPDNLIDYLPSLLNKPIQHYSCFISYSSKDDDFARRIHADLQNSGVRCWFAPHDLPIGDKILDGIDAAIRLRDKVVLILSEYSIKSDWVEDEVTAGFEEERKRGQIVLFPVRLDEAVMSTNEAWAAKLRARNIGDFRKWKDHDAYKQSPARVLRDLTKPQGR
jgi:TIR domain/Pentapeptide repeats (8 copies)